MKTITLTLTEREVNDIRLALIAAMKECNHGGDRFMKLRDKIISQQKSQKEE